MAEQLFAASRRVRGARSGDGGLPKSDMPATVEDAMEACRRFGITQDDDGHKAEQVAAVAAIYSLAELVIVVTDGDSDSGIAGLFLMPEKRPGRGRKLVAYVLDVIMHSATSRATIPSSTTSTIISASTVRDHSPTLPIFTMP